MTRISSRQLKTAAVTISVDVHEMDGHRHTRRLPVIFLDKCKGIPYIRQAPRDGAKLSPN